MKYLANLLEWVFAHPILTLILAYTLACILDLVLPTTTDRGSWWNIAYWLLRLVCVA